MFISSFILLSNSLRRSESYFIKSSIYSLIMKLYTALFWHSRPFHVNSIQIFWFIESFGYFNRFFLKTIAYFYLLAETKSIFITNENFSNFIFQYYIFVIFFWRNACFYIGQVDKNMIVRSRAGIIFFFSFCLFFFFSVS
jgi:hypothetical protein